MSEAAITKTLEIAEKHDENIKEKCEKELNEEKGNIEENTSAASQEPIPKRKRLNKTEKKKLRYEKRVQSYKQKKQLKKLEKQAKNSEKANEESNNSDSQPNETNTAKGPKKRKVKRLERSMINQRLTLVNTDEETKAKSLKVCIDCSFCFMMSEKEQSRLAQQIGRCYALNRASSSPAHVLLCNLAKDSYFYKELCRINDGFESYLMNKTDKSVEEIHANSLDKLCYLSPDAKNLLNEIDVNCTYVIGGLVDETVTKKVTLSKCEKLNVNTFRLPIEEVMSRRSNDDPNDRGGYNFNKILSVNQVLGILLELNVHKDWKKALMQHVPKRKGFFVDEDAQKKT